MDGAPIELYGFDSDGDVILARRAGEPSFVWVQDLVDAFQAAQSRGVDVVVTGEFRDALLAHGEPPSAVRRLRVV